MMSYLRYVYKSNNVKLVIEEDVIGFYFVIYRNPHSDKSNEDYLFDSLDEAFQVAKDQFHVKKTEWEMQKI